MSVTAAATTFDRIEALLGDEATSLLERLDSEGVLEVAALEMIFHIAEASFGGFEGTMNVPAQGATGVPLGSVVFESGTLSFLIPDSVRPTGSGQASPLSRNADVCRRPERKTAHEAPGGGAGQLSAATRYLSARRPWTRPQ